MRRTALGPIVVTALFAFIIIPARPSLGRETQVPDRLRRGEAARGNLNDAHRGSSRSRGRTREDLEQVRSQIARMREDRDTAKRTKEDLLMKLSSELRQLDAASFQPASDVVALVATELKSGTQTVGHVRKGEKLTIEKAQGDWLYVRNGWIHRKCVAPHTLMEWYERLPDNGSVEHGERARAKFRDVTFDILNAGSGPSVMNFRNNRMTRNGKPVSAGNDSLTAKYGNVKVYLEGTGSGTWRFAVNQTPHGTLRVGDHVCIDAARRVFVNGLARAR